MCEIGADIFPYPIIKPGIEANAGEALNNSFPGRIPHVVLNLCQLVVGLQQPSESQNCPEHRSMANPSALLLFGSIAV